MATLGWLIFLHLPCSGFALCVFAKKDCHTFNLALLIVQSSLTKWKFVDFRQHKFLAKHRLYQEQLVVAPSASLVSAGPGNPTCLTITGNLTSKKRSHIMPMTPVLHCIMLNYVQLEATAVFQLVLVMRWSQTTYVLCESQMTLYTCNSHLGSLG